MRMTPAIVITALLFSAFMGLIGGLAPAWHASRQNILNALRD
jgi:ABC-type antimicrobial peptide transport system permease subunit